MAEIKISYSTKVPARDRPKITCSKDAADLIRTIYEDMEYRETFYIMLLNRGNRVLGFNLVSVGGISGTVIDVRCIYQSALKANASSMILFHNHPSGTLEPSDADLKITRKISNAGKLLDISVLDHVILTTDDYISLADNGQMY